jgi:hypothetical protein
MTMPTFEIPDGPTTVELKRTGDAKTPGPATGSIVFNVTNKSPDACDGRLGVVVSGDSKEAWFSVEGDRERTFAAGETQTATINVSAPPGTAAGNYPFRLRAVAVNDPDNDHAEGPVATAQVPGSAPVAKGSKMWLWILIGVVVLLLIIVALWFAFRSKPEPAPGTMEVAKPAEAAKPAAPVAQAACPLTGTWRGSDGGVYDIMESGSSVTWNGRYPAPGGWAHRFTGRRNGDTIEGDWADYQGNTGRGTLTIHIDSPSHLTRVGSTGSGFGGTSWMRRGCP